MIDRGFGLSDLELISLICYVDDSHSCTKMKEYHRGILGLQLECKWRNLYFHLTRGVDKIHQCFHLGQTAKPSALTLYHGTTCDKLDIYSREQLLMKTITSFTSKPSTAKGFAGRNGCVLVIDEAGISMKKGILRAADVQWISMYDESECVVLPTTFHHFKQWTAEQIKERCSAFDGCGCQVYATRRYKSNKVALCIRSDNIAESEQPVYKGVLTDSL